MEGAAELAQRAWNTWGMRVLLLLSFALQVTLLIFAEIRRRKKSSVVCAIVWSAYMLADTVAVYTLGHFFVTGRSAEHEVMALWVPLLLVHLGGQDNITAYAIEDNRLWLRHLQNLGVQVVAAAYALYQSSILGRPTWLRASTILMFVVGVLKYGERIWALKCASSVQSSEVVWLKGFERNRDMDLERDVDKMYHAIQMHLSQMYNTFYSKAVVMCTWYGICIRVTSLLATLAAFLVFHLFCHKTVYNSVDGTATYILLAGAVVLDITSVSRLMFSTTTMDSLMRSRWRWCNLLHRLLESVGQRNHSSIRIRKAVSELETMYWSGSMGQLDLFHLCARTRDSQRSKIVRWMGNCGRWIRLDFSWSIPIPRDIITMLMDTRVHQHEETQSVPRLEEEIESQLDELRTEGKRNRKRAEISEELWVMVMRLVDQAGLRFLGMGFQREIDTLLHRMESEYMNGRTAETARELTKMVNRRVDQSELRLLGVRRMGFQDEIESLLSGQKLEESILVWHIATHVLLKWYDKYVNHDEYGDHPEVNRLVKVTEALSNYMIYLLAAHPMKPTGSRHRSCSLNDMVKNAKHIRIRVDELLEHAAAGVYTSYLVETDSIVDIRVRETFSTGVWLGQRLTSEDMDDERAMSMALLWVHMLNMVDDKLGEDFHVKQLINGGEFLTVLRISVIY